RRAAGRAAPRDRRAVQEPGDGHAGGMAPEDVGLAVTVEVGGSHDGPIGAHEARRTGAGDRGAVQEPGEERPSGVAPQDVSLVVAVEITRLARGAGHTGVDADVIDEPAFAGLAFIGPHPEAEAYVLAGQGGEVELR